MAPQTRSAQLSVHAVAGRSARSSGHADHLTPVPTFILPGAATEMYQTQRTKKDPDSHTVRVHSQLTDAA